MPPLPARARIVRDAQELPGVGRPRGRLPHSRRQHFAILAAIIAISGFVFVLLQPRDVKVVADGEDLTISTHRSNDAAVLRAAGIELDEGDIVASGGEGLEVERARDVRITADGRLYELRTRAGTIEEVLAEANLMLEERDSVLQNGSLASPAGPIEPPVRLISTTAGSDPEAVREAVFLEVRRAHPFVIIEGGREMMSTTSRPTVAQALREAGVQVRPGDVVTPDLQAAMTVDARIEVLRAHPVTISMAEGQRVVYTHARTVAEVLEAERIVLPQGAYVHPSLETQITGELAVRVVQLGSTADVEYEYIESGTVYVADPALSFGETRTEPGQSGVRTRRFEIQYVDGVEVGRELIEETLDPEPRDTVIYYSERSAEPAPPPSVRGPASGEPPVDGRPMRVYATAYNAASAGRSPDDPYYGITATGVRVSWGVVAVDPNVIPLGTRMYVPGYGYAVAADTGGAVQGNIIDLGYPDGVPIDWVTSWIEIYILE